MKKNNFLFLLLFLLFSCGDSSTNTKTEENKKDSSNVSAGDGYETNEVKAPAEIPDFSGFISGDIIFQTITGGENDLIAEATQSPFTHCGIILKDEKGYWVIEANGKVNKTPLKIFIAQGEANRIVVMRLKSQYNGIIEQNKKKGGEKIKSLMGLPYDSKYLWNDSEMYCSELVWKIYSEVLNIELCPLRKLGDFQLDSPAIKSALQAKYGSEIPVEEPIVAPSDLAASNELEMIFSNY